MSELERRASEIGWYHTIELAPGHVTEGMFDLRPFVERYGLPERMEGMRALDVGTWDGFWAFEMERRGAEVVALDVDREFDLDAPARRRLGEVDGPRGMGFTLAREMLGSKVERVAGSIYDATPTDLGTFDLVMCGSVLIHLRDQLLALERIAALCRGTFISAEEYHRGLGLFPFPVARYHADRPSAVVFWQPSARAWRRMLRTAGFDTIDEHGRFTLRSPQGFGVRHVVNHARHSVTAPRTT